MMQQSQVVVTKYPLKCCNTKEGRAWPEPYISQWNYTMIPAERASMVFEILGTGEENALSPDYLRTVLGFKSNRALQKQIEFERSQGRVILSSTTPPGEYYLPADVSEIRRFIATLENRSRNTLLALKSARDYLNSCGIDGE